ncbi:predicted protein [Histoplasma mississippiense (nom. inval.)]|uniref:predicted protein n=1 Tax=Ajellomyces capsulatus (strain NAm1 / WU24) TaxID=2059318 RepID=UPI000157C52B|nr:predicted protein [Histoplasma mississippiense (nom. inval.)]EDN08254.1 predicted protein [Histoplasma mississippiense (nom. inval.)]
MPSSLPKLVPLIIKFEGGKRELLGALRYILRVWFSGGGRSTRSSRFLARSLTCFWHAAKQRHDSAQVSNVFNVRNRTLATSTSRSIKSNTSIK